MKNKTETNSQIQETNCWLPEGEEVEGIGKLGEVG